MTICIEFYALQKKWAKSIFSLNFYVEKAHRLDFYEAMPLYKKMAVRLFQKSWGVSELHPGSGLICLNARLIKLHLLWYQVYFTDKF